MESFVWANKFDLPKCFQKLVNMFYILSLMCAIGIICQGDTLRNFSLRCWKSNLHISNVPKSHTQDSLGLEVMAEFPSCATKVDIFCLPLNMAYLAVKYLEVTIFTICTYFHRHCLIYYYCWVTFSFCHLTLWNVVHHTKISK